MGTVTVKDKEICRLFVLPSYQGRGYGTEMLNYAEKIIANQYSEIVVDASLPAKTIYLARRYRENGFHIISTENGVFLCYDVMTKLV